MDDQVPDELEYAHTPQEILEAKAAIKAQTDAYIERAMDVMGKLKEAEAERKKLDLYRMILETNIQNIEVDIAIEKPSDDAPRLSWQIVSYVYQMERIRGRATLLDGIIKHLTSVVNEMSGVDVSTPRDPEDVPENPDADVLKLVVEEEFIHYSNSSMRTECLIDLSGKIRLRVRSWCTCRAA